MTQDAKFSIFSGDITTPKLLVESEPLVFVDYGINLHGHLARTQEPSEMLVSTPITKIPSHINQSYLIQIGHLELLSIFFWCRQMGPSP